MAVYNTSSDSANTMVRAFLTKVGESYIGHGFNKRQVYMKSKESNFFIAYVNMSVVFVSKLCWR